MTANLEHNFIKRFLDKLPGNFNRNGILSVGYMTRESDDSAQCKYEDRCVEHKIITPSELKGLETDIALVWCDSNLVPLFGQSETDTLLLCQQYQFYEKLKGHGFNPKFFDSSNREIDFLPREKEILAVLGIEFVPRHLRHHEYVEINRDGLVSLDNSARYGNS